MAPFKIHPDALREVDEAVLFYESKQSGLGKRFLDALDEAALKARRSPRLYPEIEGRIRKCRLSKFPYGIIYRCSSQEIEILAGMHLKRRPDYWKSRK